MILKRIIITFRLTNWISETWRNVYDIVL